MLGLLPDAVNEIEKALTARGMKRHICVALPHLSAAVSLLSGTDLVLTAASRSVNDSGGNGVPAIIV